MRRKYLRQEEKKGGASNISLNPISTIVGSFPNFSSFQEKRAERWEISSFQNPS
jgi:hypothetical protein